ncbi:MAG: glycosyltransferase family 39 protein, partial [Chloroflexota bacterium]|nr:glycosyltransferase family 39 protein [Chloroflexota bacterium]
MRGGRWPAGSYWYAACFAAVLAAAVFLRFWQLNVLPVGFHHDDALDGLSAAGVLTGTRPIFFNNYNPREPLMVYFQSIGILLFGPTRLGASSMPAAFGVAEVLLAWFLARDLFGRRVALLTAGFTAVSFWHVFVSRLSERAISQPLVEGLCLLFFWRTLARRRWLDATLAGLLLGLSLYTYTAARALPILLLLLVLWQLIAAPGFWRKSIGQMAVVAAIGLAVFFPLGLHFLQHPGDFFGRSLEVNVIAPQPFTGSAQAGGLRTAVLNTLGMFSIRGDGAWKYNLSGQPVFDWPMSALFYGGLAVAVAGAALYLRQRRQERPAANPYVFVLLWLPVMLIPGFLSSESPHFLRTIGIVPAVFVFPALAVDWLARRGRPGGWRGTRSLAENYAQAAGAERPSVDLRSIYGLTGGSRGRRWISGEAPTPRRPAGGEPGTRDATAPGQGRWAANGFDATLLVLPLAALLLAGEGAQTYRHYFQDWAHSAQAYYANHGDVADAAAYLDTAPNLPILFSTEYPNHPTILFLAPRVFPRIRWFNGQQSLAFPPAGQKTLYVFPANYQPRWAELSKYFRPDQMIHEGRDPAGAVAYRVYESDGPPPEARPLQPLRADLGGLAELQGAAFP